MQDASADASSSSGPSKVSNLSRGILPQPAAPGEIITSEPMNDDDEGETAAKRPKRASEEVVDDGSHLPAAPVLVSHPWPPRGTKRPPTSEAQDHSEATATSWQSAADSLEAHSAKIGTAVSVDAAGVERDDTVGSREVFKHPGPIVERSNINKEDMQWQDIGSDFCENVHTSGEAAHHHSRRATDWRRAQTDDMELKSGSCR